MSTQSELAYPEDSGRPTSYANASDDRKDVPRPENRSCEVLAGLEGAKRAAEHADRVVGGRGLWQKIATIRALEFLRATGVRGTFVSEDLRRWCEAHDVPAPPDSRAWGTIMRTLSKKGLISDTGERPKAGSHGREVVRWRVGR